MSPEIVRSLLRLGRRTLKTLLRESLARAPVCSRLSAAARTIFLTVVVLG
jgi:hypothetical protein